MTEKLGVYVTKLSRLISYAPSKSVVFLSTSILGEQDIVLITPTNQKLNSKIAPNRIIASKLNFIQLWRMPTSETMTRSATFGFD